MKAEFNRMTAALLLTTSLLTLSVVLLPRGGGKFAPSQEIAMLENEERSDVPSSSYYIPLTEENKQNIRYIITTLATKSSISLMFYKQALNEAGNKLDPVHPLTFLAYVFTDGTLKNYVKQISGMPWTEFVKGMAGSLRSAANRSDLPDAALSDFAAKIGVDRAALENSIEAHRWDDFINQTRSHLP